MELKILSDKKNELAARREIEFSIVQEGGTPKRNEIQQELCKRLNLNPESTLVVSVDQSFGTRQSSGMAHSYQTKEQMEKVEPVHIMNRVRGIKGKAQAPKEAAPKKEEKAEAKK